MKITSFSLNNFAPEEFLGGLKSVLMNAPKILECDRTMKAFSFVERNKRQKFVKQLSRYEINFLIQLKSVFLQAGKEVIAGWKLAGNHLVKDNEQITHVQSIHIQTISNRLNEKWDKFLTT